MRRRSKVEKATKYLETGERRTSEESKNQRRGLQIKSAVKEFGKSYSLLRNVQKLSVLYLYPNFGSIGDSYRIGKNLHE
jgi:hypothetical protein